MHSQFHVRPFRDSDTARFAELSQQWIEQLFVLELADAAQLADPRAVILAKGGFIAIAETDGVVVGTGGILPAAHPPADGKRWLEVVKMATDPSQQGRGIGSAVLTRLLHFAAKSGVDAVWLETNAALGAATALYHRHGFATLARKNRWPTPYGRCNLQMVRET